MFAFPIFKLFLSCNVILAINAEFIPYNNEIIFPLRPAYLTIPKYSPKVVPSWKPGNGRSYIDLTHVSLELACDDPDSKSSCKPSNFDMVIFEAPEDKNKPWMQHWPSYNFCCSQEMADLGKCALNSANSLLIPSDIPNIFKRTITIHPNEEVSLSDGPLDFDMQIKDTGVYVIIMAVCKEDATPVKLRGTIESMNPYGYLPADLFSNIPFFGTMTFAYTFIGIIWMIACSLYSEQLISLQLWITLVLLLGMSESSILFSHYLNWNDDGVMTLSITICGVIFGVMKRTVSRVVVLMVSMGYGVVRPTLGDDMKKIMYLGCSYFILSLVYTLTVSMPSNAKFVGDPEFENMIALVVLLLAAVDSTFYMWILKSLNNIIITLESRRQVEKCNLYKNFRSVLFVSLAFALIWAIYSSMLLAGQTYETNWQSRWTMDALWEFEYLVIFIAICILWAPSRNNQRYAYSAVEMSDQSATKKGSLAVDSVGDDEDDDDELQRQDALNRINAEYGNSRDMEESDPFMVSGALDPDMAIVKKA